VEVPVVEETRGENNGGVNAPGAFLVIIIIIIIIIINGRRNNNNIIIINRCSNEFQKRLQ